MQSIISTVRAINQAIWLRKVMQVLEMIYDEATIIWVDNKSVISMAKNLILRTRTKHIKVKCHALKEAEANREVKLKYCNSEDQIVDFLTKSLPTRKFKILKLQIDFVKNLKEEF